MLMSCKQYVDIPCSGHTVYVCIKCVPPNNKNRNRKLKEPKSLAPKQ